MVVVARGLLERELRDAGFLIAEDPAESDLPVVVLGRARRRLTAGPIEIDLKARVVTVRGRAAGLSHKEYELLVRLADDPERVFTREELLRDVWGFQGTARTRTIDVYASRLRRKLRELDDSCIFVDNHWGVGYRLLGLVAQ
jgi:two-component system response regulator ResD